MKKVIILALIAIIFVAQTQAQTDADAAQGLLESLHRDAQDSLRELRENWATNGGLLNDNVVSWENSYNAQNAECQNRDAVIEDLVQQQNANEDFLSWISDSIRETVAKQQKNYDDRCAANRNYITGLKNDKILVRLIEFLRQAITAKDSLSLLERKEFTENFMHFLQLYQVRDTKALLQLHTKLTQEPQAGQDHVNDSQFDIDNVFDTAQRTEEQIGNQHVDDNREDITVDNFQNGERRSFSEYKAQLLELLDQLQAEVEQKVGSSQEDEVNAGIAAAEYRIHLDKELQELDTELYIQIQLTSSLARRLREADAAAQQCHQQLEKVVAAYEEAQTVYDEAFGKFQEKETSSLDEVEVFEYVLEQYTANVSGDDFREQLDDYTADGSYDDQYDERQVDQIDFVNDQTDAESVPAQGA